VSKCVPAVGYGLSCAPGTNYKCRTITDYLFCSANLCSLVQYTGACSVDAQCDHYKNLKCISNTCGCPDEYYWNAALNQCSMLFLTQFQKIYKENFFFLKHSELDISQIVLVQQHAFLI
jgi:hypothetical protein